MTISANCAVWLVDGRQVADPAIDAYCDWLGDVELQRYRRFVRHERRRQFVIGRVLLRQALGSLLGVPARAILLEERHANAPRVVAPLQPGIGLSLSHSGPWIACAVSADTALGLDIEVIDPARDVMALARQAFGDAEAAALAAGLERTRLRRFYDLWCTHEARIKLQSDSKCDYLMGHPALAAALCSARPLAVAPALSLISLAP